MTAALAWLGGGTIGSGGAGMAGGNAFLAMFGPIGLGIAVLGISAAYLRNVSKTKENLEKAKKWAESKKDEINNRLLKVNSINNGTEEILTPHLLPTLPHNSNETRLTRDQAKLLFDKLEELTDLWKNRIILNFEDSTK